MVNIGTSPFSLSFPFSFLLPHLFSPLATSYPPLGHQITTPLSTMASTRDHGKMPIILFHEGSSNPPLADPKHQSAIMAIDVTEVEPLTVIPPAEGQPGIAGTSSDPPRGRPTLALLLGCPCFTPWSLYPCGGLTKPSSR